jgi:hypothetical protein
MFKILRKYKLEEILLLLVILSLPLPEHWNTKVLLLLTIFVLARYLKNSTIEIPKLAWFYVLFFLFAGFSIFWSENKYHSNQAILRLLPFLLFGFGYKHLFNFENPIRVYRIASIGYVFYGFILIILGLVRFSMTSNLDTFFYHQLTSPFQANAIYIALLFASLASLYLYQILFLELKTNRIDLILVFLLFGFQILLSSKMILTMLFFVLVVIIGTYIRKNGLSKKNTWKGITIALSLFFLFSISSFTKNRFTEIADYKQIKNVFSADYFGRVYYWNGLTLRLFQLRCFYEIENGSDFNSYFGSGFNASQSRLNAKYAHYDLYRGPTGEGENDGYFVYNFHNQYAQLLIELGIFGGILIVLMLYFFVLYPIQNKNILFLTIGLLFLSFALTESYLLRQKGVVAFVLFPLLADRYATKISTKKSKLTP